MLRILLICLVFLASPARADWDAARAPGAVLLMRHALAPGTGDPAAFRLNDCTTQRNLSDEGRAQARAVGAALAAQGIRPVWIATSQWCRTRDTAAELGLGPVEDWPALNSFFQDRAEGPAQTAAVLDGLAARAGQGPFLLVTHQVNITALTGIVPRSGEIIVAERDGGTLRVTGRLPPP
jgi:broad specificity phosphatase PhoE